MAEAAPQENDIRPIVARRRPSNLGLWVFMGLVLLGGLWIFSALSANRATVAVPSVIAPTTEPGARLASAPPLALPPEYLIDYEGGRQPPVRLIRQPVELVQAPVRPSGVSQPAPVASRQPASSNEWEDDPEVHQYVPPPAIVYDRGLPPHPIGTSSGTNGSQARVMADRLANPSQTVPQGTVIPAVLETALDSTRPGAVRALVQRNIYGFDGSRVLIHRGSRLYGEYASDLSSGQKRALVRWTRLIRPDGVTIALDSPASDPLGRAGIKGKVDSKFFQRFGGAILQSILDIGVGLATREVTDGVIVALPGSTQNVRVQDQQQVQPTLKVNHGTSVSVFVARDLDFSSVDP